MKITNYRQNLLFLWESPTLMTWGSFLCRSLSAVLILPMVLRNFPEEQITLWFMFAQIISLQLLVDMGFTPTFSRLIAHAKGQSNSSLVAKIKGIMDKVYLRMTLISFALLLSIGTYFVYKPINQLGSGASAGWVAWGMVVFTSLFYLRGNQYSAYLQGISQIATLRRWEVLIALGGILSSFLVLLFDGGLLGIVIASQLWVLLGILLNRWLVKRNIYSSPESNQQHEPIYAEPISVEQLFKNVWETAWRSGLGVLISFGTLRFASLYIGKGETSEQAAVFLFGLRIIEMINEFAQAPVYSKLPRLATLYAERNIGVMMGVAKQGMARSHLIFVGAFILASLFGDFALEMIGSKTKFPESELWICLGFAYFFQRFGAMHLHLFSTTNQIIWHKVNAIAGAIFMVSFFAFYQLNPIYSYATALLISSLLFYSWYCAYRSYKEFGLQFWQFEKSVSLLPLLLLIIYAIARYYIDLR